MILVVFLVFVQCIILIDILNIWSCLVWGVITLVIVIIVWWVTLWVVDTLISFKDRSLFSIPIRTTEVVVVIIGRVSPYRIEDSLIGISTSSCKEVLIRSKLLFFLISQSIKADILFRTTTLWGCEGVSNRTLCWYFTPLCCCPWVTTVYRHTTLVELLTIFQYVFRHLSKVDIEVTTILVCIW